MIDSAALRARLADVRARIARAAGRAGRDPASIRLVAVSKTFPADYVRAAADAGQLDFGENKVQEALPKMDQTADLAVRWHLIGHLQSNKARKAGARSTSSTRSTPRRCCAKLDEAARRGRTARSTCSSRSTWPAKPTKHGAREDELPADLRRGARAAAPCRLRRA